VFWKVAEIAAIVFFPRGKRAKNDDIVKERTTVAFSTNLINCKSFLTDTYCRNGKSTRQARVTVEAIVWVEFWGAIDDPLPPLGGRLPPSPIQLAEFASFTDQRKRF
jgi:hypothetical protein